MGYQESYVTINGNINKLTKIIKDKGKEFFEERFIQPVLTITLNKEIKGNFDMMCRPDKKYKFNKGDKFIYFVGERYGQRSIKNMFGDIENNNIEIIFTECFPSDDIFNKDSGCAIHEPFKWD